MFFYIGSTLGWVVEVLFRRIVHKEWVNPGFLKGPWLPIYGFGLCCLNLIYTLCGNLSWWFNILLMGLVMTLLELIGGLSFLKSGVKLWDYSDMPLNYKGIICPTFSLIWIIIGVIYYFYLASPIDNMINWFANNLSFSFVLGVFFGLIVLDYIESTKLFMKIRKFAKENNIEVKYEELKFKIKEGIEKQKEKYHFLSAFGSPRKLMEYLEEYKKSKTINKNLFQKIKDRHNKSYKRH